MLNYASLADRVAASYSEKPTIQTADDIRLMLDPRADELLVVAPGTTDLAGWMDDFSGWPRLFDELGYYHEGFGSNGIALFRALMPKLPAAGSGSMVTYTGHSLGAALALTLAILHARSFFGAHRLVTFGSPRCAAMWNRQAPAYLATARDKRRFSRVGDPIPELPGLPTYRHLVPDSPIGIPVLSGGPMINHSIDLYVADIKAAAL